ncbi:MAG: monovalent cation/H+ antiporter subunit A, partial [Burkholderiales bacterium]|nr:monovalent cation/H+ antiporter subunit A [Burkholderiales bacterium]
HGRSRTTIAWSAALAPAIGLALLALIAPTVFGGGAVAARVPWMPEEGFDIALRIDGLAWLFTGMIFAIGLLVILYGRYYLSPDDPFGRFFAMLLGFMGAMVGIAVSDNLVLTLVFWELTSLSSFLLIGYWQHRPDARQGARIALAVTGMGGLALLGGVLLLGHIAGTFTISELLDRGDVIRASPSYAPALILVLLGAFTKSAQVPFHFWLPNAMAAPTPVSAYLHSATMVKAGIFLLARLWPALSGTELWFWLVAGTGLLTFVWGAWTAMFRHDLKGLLAYSTISHLGLIVLLLGLNSPLAAVAAVFHIINHATFKASLFMAAGIVDHETGTRDMRRLSGLWRYMPWTGALAFVASASMAGVPLLNGFLSKEMLFAETLALERAGVVGLLFPMAATLGGIFGVAYSTRFVHDVFFGGEPHDLPRAPHEPPRWMRIPVEVLVALCLLVGILPGLTVAPLLAVAAGSVIHGPLPAYSLHLWHGFNLPLVMSAVALVAGIALYFVLRQRLNLHARVGGPWTGARLYDSAIFGLIRFARRFTRRTADGTLQRQVVLLLIMTLLVAIVPFAGPLPEGRPPAWASMNGIAICIWIVLAVSTGAVVALHRQRLTALILTGAVGLAVSLIFAWFSAPDLALTQLSVEVATVLLMLLALPFLPAVTPLESSAGRRLRDGTLAALLGIGMGLAAWWMMTTDGSTVAVEHIARSVPEGGGSNVVNVILVDFRGFDTYGEITVLAIAALGIVALLAKMADGGDAGVAGVADPFRPVMLDLLSRLLVPMALVVAAYLFLRGHNLPGGGFVAGLVTGVVLIVVYMGNGARWTHERLRTDFHRPLAAGLAVAGATGIGAWFYGHPFLTSAHGPLHLPVLGDLHWATAAAFDLGVFLVVVATVMLVLESLGRLTPPKAA